MLKSSFDFLGALIGLIIFSPLLILSAIAIKLDSPGPVFFRQERVGKNFAPFMIHKFRTMRTSASSDILTSGNNDSRITRVGRIIRKIHLDEIVQLLDVLQGNMSIVGSRPEIPEFVKYYPDNWKIILKLKPGITGLGAVKLAKYEYDMLQNSQNKNQDYIEKILPKKLRIEKFYTTKQSFCFDIKILWMTIKYFF